MFIDLTATLTTHDSDGYTIQLIDDLQPDYAMFSASFLQAEFTDIEGESSYEHDARAAIYLAMFQASPKLLQACQLAFAALPANHSCRTVIENAINDAMAGVETARRQGIEIELV